MRIEGKENYWTNALRLLQSGFERRKGEPVGPFSLLTQARPKLSKGKTAGVSPHF